MSQTQPNPEAVTLSNFQLTERERGILRSLDPMRRGVMTRGLSYLLMLIHDGTIKLPGKESER